METPILHHKNQFALTLRLPLIISWANSVETGKRFGHAGHSFLFWGRSAGVFVSCEPIHVMPNVSQAAELFERLRAVETSINTHRAECDIRNQQRQRWEAEIDGAVDSLKLDRAKFVGIAIAVSTVASALGSGGVIALLKVLGQQ